MGKYDSLIEELNIDETLTKAPKGKKKYNKVKDNIPLVEDLNFGADVLFLPTTKQGFKYLLVVVDLASDEFDIEPLKNKEPKTILQAMKTMFKRGYIKKPYASVTTDAGTEFKGVFKDWLNEENIIHKIGLPGRHKQNANVESLNRILGRFINGYMNSIEIKTNKTYREWTEILIILRRKINSIRKKKLPSNPRTYEYSTPKLDSEPKFKVGNMVHRMLDKPRNAINEQQSGSFREGDFKYDLVPRKIKKLLYYPEGYRYMLNGIHQASYAEYELIKSKDIDEEVEEIKKIIDYHFNRKEKMKYYKVWFYNELRKEAGWMSEKDLLNDIGRDSLDEFISIYEDTK